MKVELLTVPGCPNRALAVDRLRHAVVLAGLESLRIAERVVDDPSVAAALGMNGSPTILINGRDPFQDHGTEPSVSCRLYASDNGVSGAPTVDELVAALTGASTR